MNWTELHKEALELRWKLRIAKHNEHGIGKKRRLARLEGKAWRRAQRRGMALYNQAYKVYISLWNEVERLDRLPRTKELVERERQVLRLWAQARRRADRRWKHYDQNRMG